MLDIQVIPLADPLGNIFGVSVSFADITHCRRSQEDLDHSHQALETARNALQSTHEQWEITEEESQSSNEDLRTASAGLQSAIGELETVDEELQSSNEELHIVNDELHNRIDELTCTHRFWGSVLESIRSGVVAVDQEMRVTAWNKRATDLWGLRAGEVKEKNLLSLGIGLPVEQISELIRAGLATEYKLRDLNLAAINRHGKTIQCQITCSPLLDSNGQATGVILLMEESAL